MSDSEERAPHLYRCAMGGELYGGELRWCYMCLDWVVEGTPCPGEFKVAQSSGYRS
jgi:hypothetical protein